MFPGGIRQDEVIETVRQRLIGDADAEVGHVGEVRQALLARRVVLAEDHLARRAVLGTPGADATLQRAAQPIPVAVGMAPLHLLQHRHRAQARTDGEQRQDVALPQAAERVSDLSPERSFGGFLRGKSGIVLNPASGALAEAGLGGGDALWMVAAEFHVQSHLLVGGGASGHIEPRPGSRGSDPARTHAATRGRVKTRAAGLAGLRLGYARPAISQTGHPTCR